MTKRPTKAKKTKTQTCKTCSKTFEVVYGNAKYCSPECRSEAINKREAKKTPEQLEKEHWEKRKKEYLKREMALQQKLRKAKGLPPRDEEELRQVLLSMW
jgi:hypothetical protein